MRYLRNQGAARTVAMSWIIAFRLSPKLAALTEPATFRPPRKFIEDQRASLHHLGFRGNDEERLPACTPASSKAVRAVRGDFSFSLIR